MLTLVSDMNHISFGKELEVENVQTGSYRTFFVIFFLKVINSLRLKRKDMLSYKIFHEKIKEVRKKS